MQQQIATIQRNRHGYNYKEDNDIDEEEKKGGGGGGKQQQHHVPLGIRVARDTDRDVVTLLAAT